MLKLFIQSSKTDRYRDGAWIVLPSSGKVTCPVAMMKRHLERTKLSYNSPFFVSFQKLNVAISLDLKVYLRLRDLDSIATPSVRSGGATAAAANAGVPDRLFKWHCRWSSESTRIVMSKILFPRVCLYLRL